MRVWKFAISRHRDSQPSELYLTLDKVLNSWLAVSGPVGCIWVSTGLWILIHPQPSWQLSVWHQVRGKLWDGAMNVLIVNCHLSQCYRSLLVGPTASCTVFLPGLVNYLGHVLLSITCHVGATLKITCWRRASHGTDRLTRGPLILDIFSLKLRGVDLYADHRICRNIQSYLIILKKYVDHN